MKQLYKDIKKLYAEHRDVILSEGWCISKKYNVQYEVLSVIKYNGYYMFDLEVPMQLEAIKNARTHGIICDCHNTIIDINKKQFEKTLYLWQAKELGLL